MKKQRAQDKKDRDQKIQSSKKIVDTVYSVMNDNLQELNRVEELLQGHPLHLASLCVILMNWNRSIEAKGIFDRQKLQIGHFEKTNLGYKIS
jgi:hypothetical protein